MNEYIKIVVMLTNILSKQGLRVAGGQIKQHQKRTVWRTGRWSTETTSVLETAWMRVWIQTLTLKETWLFLTKQQFFQKLTHPSAATARGRVGRPRSKRRHGTAMTKTSWRPNLLYTDRLRYHSLGLKSIALVSLSGCCKAKRIRKPILVSFPCRFWACCALCNLRATQASAVGCWASWSLAGAKTWDDWSLRQSDGPDSAGWSQQVRYYQIMSGLFSLEACNAESLHAVVYTLNARVLLCCICETCA